MIDSLEKVLKLDELEYYTNKLMDVFVQKEYKTGSDKKYKGLSDNNFSDEYRNKLDNMGDYENLENKPAIDRTELYSSTTSSDLGLVKKSELSGYVKTKDFQFITSDDINSLFT